MKVMLAAIVFFVIVVTGCSPTKPAAMLPEPPGEARTHEALNAVLWTQTAVEYRAVTMQAYATARRALNRALADSNWSAALEQRGDYTHLPPAIILDADETALDNSPYQARRILADGGFTRDSWKAWVEEAAARPVPGALAFAQYAASKGVAVFFVSNRRAALEAATRHNLAEQGFPVAPNFDSILLRGEKPDWETSDKTPRRAAIAKRYRILLLVGDNLGDFIGDVNQTIARRAAMAKPYDSYWGERWIMLPNPQYGSWQGALFDFDYSLSREGQLKRAYERLRIQ